MSAQKATIIYTRTDEAPALATWSLLPIIKAFCQTAEVPVELRDISLAGRIIAGFPEWLAAHQQQPDALAELGELTADPLANIIKLPNISASVPQIKAAISELQAQGYPLPDYPEEPADAQQQAVRARYDRVKGSAVNPVLRQGNSDRRAPAAVKRHARNNPHAMGAWSAQSQSHVASMTAGDFFGSEQSITVPADTRVRIQHTAGSGRVTVLKQDIALQAGEIIDSGCMSKTALRDFLAEQMADAREQDLLFSLHLKATMMKVSDPILFGHAVTVYYAAVFARYRDVFARLGVEPNNGIGDVYARIRTLPDAERAAIEADIQAVYQAGPALAMVDSGRGITNLHVPSDVIIDASMPAALRASGKMWGADGELHDIKAVIPDRCYAAVYQQVIDFCKAHGAFDPATMGSVPNVGLMARQAEEYGSHDKTFEVPAAGSISIVDSSGATLTQHQVEAGDIWRMCQVQDAPIRDWVKLAVKRARLSGMPVVFWLNEQRPHDRELSKKVGQYLADQDTRGLEIQLMSPATACGFSLQRMAAGKDTISATGNVLRDYLTDLFPILELGTSAKMLSIVPLMRGGGLFETGAGGSAPRHVQQFVAENHLRWDSLGEFLAVAASLEHLAEVTNNQRAGVLAQTLDQATGRLLDTHKSPSRRVNELDNRGSHFYLCLYWAEALAGQSSDPALQSHFAGIARELAANESRIMDELNAVQGKAVDIGGYYRPDPALVAAAMRPSATFNQLLSRI